MVFFAAPKRTQSANSSAPRLSGEEVKAPH